MSQAPLAKNKITDVVSSCNMCLFLLKMTLRNARILSSCNDASNRQEQKMNVNIRVEDNSKQIPTQQLHQQPQSIYPQVNPVNFTTQEQQTTAEQSAYPSVAPSQYINRDVNLEQAYQIADLETKNKFLNMLLTVYQNNPIYVNSYVICDSQILMSMIKLLTDCDKVDLVLNDDIACNSCTGNDKLIYVSKILVTKGDKIEDLKYGYNDVYSKFVSYGISLKIVC